MEKIHEASVAVSPPGLPASPVSKISFGTAFAAITSKAEGSVAEQADSEMSTQPVDSVAWQQQIEADMSAVENALSLPTSSVAEPCTSDQVL